MSNTYYVTAEDKDAAKEKFEKMLRENKIRVNSYNTLCIDEVGQ